MFLCRVGVGRYCKGDSSMLAPPPLSHDGHQLFDSTVDDEHNPTKFVTYHDAQAYPEYLLRFKWSA